MIKHKAYPKIRVAFVLSDGFSAFNVAGAMRVFEAVKTATGSNSIDVDFSAISGGSAICPSSDNLGQLSVVSFGGSGSSLLEVMRFQLGGASAA